MKKRLSYYRTYFVLFSIVLFIMGIVCTGNTKVEMVTYNTNSVKSIQATHFVGNYEEEVVEDTAPVLYENFTEAVSVISTTGQTVSFRGKLTAYGPDCAGCGGGVACPPGQNVTNGNIYYNDSQYGTIRIIAADKKIPCGSIIQLNTNSGPVIGIVLDRGGSVKSSHIDLLFATERNLGGFSTQNNIRFDLLRWGW